MEEKLWRVDKEGNVRGCTPLPYEMRTRLMMIFGREQNGNGAGKIKRKGGAGYLMFVLRP